ncbi:matrixin family metalloprotease [Bdellovibrionota bacterium FG-1]
MSTRLRPKTPIALLITALLAGVIGHGCALGTDNSTPTPQLVKACIVPSDQAATIAGHWRISPIPIAFHQNDWQPDEIAEIVKAADIWNTFYSATQGVKVLDYGTDAGNVRISSQGVPTNVCGQGLLAGNQFSGPVVIYKQGTWPHASGAQSTIALTNFCTSPAKPYPSTYMAYMEVNYQYFFTAGHKIPDLQTIIAHELGHLLGLYHSCDMGSTKPGTPDCLSAKLNTDYKRALMFPVFGFNEDLTGEQKRALASNDQGRANCLYQKAAGPSP